MVKATVTSNQPDGEKILRTLIGLYCDQKGIKVKDVQIIKKTGILEFVQSDLSIEDIDEDPDNVEVVNDEEDKIDKAVGIVLNKKISDFKI